MNTTPQAKVSGPITILLAEDNPADVELTRVALDETGVNYSLEVVEDGEQAIAFINRKGKYQTTPIPNLIILDLNLPRLNGKDVLKLIRQNDNLKNITVIISTSSQAKSDITDSYRLEADYYITKPVDATKFLAALEADGSSDWISHD